MSGRQERRRAQRVVSQFTENELLCLLAAAMQAIATSEPPGEREDQESLLELRSAAQKIRRMVQMDDKTFFEFCAFAAGKPPEGIVKMFAEEDARRREASDP